MSTSADYKLAPVYLVFNGEMTLDAPIEEVWRHMIAYPTWQNYAVNQLICGIRGQEGEVVLLKKEEPGYSSPPYYARTVMIEPPRRIIWKTYRDKEKNGEEYFGFVDFRLFAEGGKTHFSSNNIYEFIIAYRDESELEAFRKKRREISESVFASTRAKLKKLVEGQG